MMKKLLSIILTVCMLFSLVIVPVTVNAEETAKVTLQYLDGTTAEATINEEGKIVYPTLAAEINVDHVWSVNEKKYELAPETTSEDITVYELKTNVLSFENYPVTEIGTGADAAYSEEAYYHKGAIYSEREFNTFVTDEAAYSGTHSMKLRDHNVRLRPSKPDNWETSGWKDHYAYNEQTKKWEKLTGDIAPAFEPYKYAYERYRANYESGMTIVKRFEKSEIPLEGEYLVTFKYKATENNQEASTLRARLILEQKQDYGKLALELGRFTFEKGATDGWQQGSFTIKANAADADKDKYGYDQVLDLQWLYGDEASTGTQYKKEIYIDDVRVVNVNDIKGVTYVSPDGSTEFIEYEVGDTINYPTTPASFKDYYVWSKSKTEYIPAPITFSESVNVYQIKSDVQSFQTDMPAINNLYNPEKYPGGMPYDEGYNDHRSMRVRNYNVRTTTAELTETNCTGFYYYDEASDSYKNITLDMFIGCNSNRDEFVATYGNVYQRRGNPSEHSIIPVYQYSSKPATDNIKLTFKYKFIQHENNNTNNKVKVFAVVSNSTSADYKYIKYDTQAINLSYSTSDEWQTAFLYADIDTSLVGLGNGSLDNTPVLSIKFEDEGGWNTSVASTFTLLIDDVQYESLGNTPTVYLHNGDEVTKVTNGVTAGDSFDLTTIGFIPEAPAGKYFIGWAKSATSASLITSIAVPSTKPYVDVYAVYKDCIDDGDKFNFQYSSRPAVSGYPYIDKNGAYATKFMGEYGRGGYGEVVADAANGLTIGKVYNPSGTVLWNDECNPKALVTAGGQQVAHTDDLAVGEETYSTGSTQYFHYVLTEDAVDKRPIVAEANSKYAVKVTYKKIGDGVQKFNIGIGINKSDAQAIGDTSATFGSANRLAFKADPVEMTNVAKDDEFLNHVFYIETGDTENVIPTFILYSEHSGFKIKRASGEGKEYTDGNVYYPYDIVDRPRVAIKEIEIIKIDDGNSVVAYNYYEDGKFTTEMKEDVKGSALDVDTKNFDTKWYSNKLTEGHRIVTTYPEEVSFINYYNAAYTQIEHPNAKDDSSKFLFGDGKKKGSDVETITFENALEDDKYSLHVAADGEVKTNDYEVFILENGLVPGNTYKVSFKYKTVTENSAFGFDLTTSHKGGFGWFDYSEGAVKATVNIDAGVTTGEWTKKVVYFTADFIGSVTSNADVGRDYIVEYDEDYQTLYMNFFQEGTNDIYFADFVIEDLGTPVVAAGASKLKDEYASGIQQQAIRYYFDYKTVDGSTLEFSNGDILTVVERGFFFRNGLSYTNDTGDFTVPIFKTSSVESVKTSDFHKCWYYNNDTGIMTFSTYVTRFKLDDDRKLEVRGYVKVRDKETGEEFIIYANKSINRTVDGIVDDEATDNDINTGL